MQLPPPSGASPTVTPGRTPRTTPRRPVPVPLSSEAVQKKIDEIGFGHFQLVLLTMTGGVMFAEGSEILVMGTITTLLRGHWELSALLRGTMVAIVFIGFAVGNLISGYVGDAFGRRRAILVGYALIGIFGFLTGIAWHPAAMVTLRFGVGLGCGIGFPSIYSIIPEVCPTHLRGSLSTIMIGFMPLGELYAALLVLLVDPDLSHSSGHCEAYAFYPNMLFPRECTWRSMCELSALPAFVFFALSYFFLSESPHYLCAKGSPEEVNEVLRRMAAMNGVRIAVNFTDPPNSPRAQDPDVAPTRLHEYSFTQSIFKLLRPPFLSTTMFMFLVHFTKDFSVFGLNYVLPQFFHDLEGFSLGMHLTVMASLSIPGVLAALILTKTTFLGHIESMQVAAACCAFFTSGMLEEHKDMAGAPCAFLSKSSAMAYFICAVVYTAEVFPTPMRNTAVGLCTCFGRAGSISAPLIFELSYEHAEGSFDVFMYVLMILMGIIALLSPFVLTLETKFRTLCHSDEEEKRLLLSIHGINSGLSTLSTDSMYGAASDSKEDPKEDSKA